ncbi:MAG: hypothetical protein KDA53_03700 [Hyphomonas sp.]|nr:hypothetical protein [Hyphomonas sp.]
MASIRTLSVLGIAILATACGNSGAQKEITEACMSNLGDSKYCSCVSKVMVKELKAEDLDMFVQLAASGSELGASFAMLAEIGDDPEKLKSMERINLAGQKAEVRCVK